MDNLGKKLFFVNALKLDEVAPLLIDLPCANYILLQN